MAGIREWLIEAQKTKCSDLHICVGLPPKVRRHGRLVSLDYPALTADDTERLLREVMEQRHLETFERDGEVDFAYSFGEDGRSRVNVFKDRATWAGAFRLITSTVPKAEDLGIPNAVTDLYKKKSGLILVTGPTGSGKSTTLASIISLINSNLAQHIITLEDPIEYLHNHKKSIVNQREIGADCMSYANGLRAALREDPDVILVGEMRDLETISIAITAAETGHLVLSTLHTIGSAATIDRIIDVFPVSQQEQVRIQLGSVIEAVISQRLIQNITADGRCAAFEVMLAVPAIRNLIRENKTYQIQSTIQTNKEIGMQTLDDSIYELYVNGRISRLEAMRNCVDYTAMEKKIMGGK
ncbi:MAG: type IV pilus twitching motility protein PilT [Clostridia bacterium]|nr:type IV pilus twitching motility protein PilT [Clostridia bacterium]